MLHNYGYRHTLRIRNTYCFSTKKGYTNAPRCYIYTYVAYLVRQDFRVQSIHRVAKISEKVTVFWYVTCSPVANCQRFGRSCSPHSHDVMAGFRSEVYENCTFLGYYTTSSANFLPTFRDNLSVPSSRATATPCIIAQSAVLVTK